MFKLQVSRRSRRWLFPALAVCALIPSALLAQTTPPKVYAVWSLYGEFSTGLSPGVLAFVNTDVGPQSSVTVQVGGRPAPVLGFTPGGRIIQIPVDLTPGPTTLVVTAGGGRLAPFNITLDSYAPALPVASGHSATGSFDRLDIGSVSQVNCLATAFGAQTLRVLAVGLGATNPPVSTGAAAPFAPPASTVAKPNLTVGGRAAEVLSSILAPGLTGVYEVTFRVPNDLPYGFQPVVLSIGGTRSNVVNLPIGFTFYNYSTPKVGGWPLYEEWSGAPQSMVTARPCGDAVTLASTAAIGDPRNPPTSLNGTTVKVKDSAGIERLAPLHYVSPFEVNYVIPAGTALGQAQVTISWGQYANVSSTLEIRGVEPALFIDEDEDVRALLVRVRNGAVTVEPLRAPIDWGPETDELYVTLFGTGLRGRSSVANVRLNLGYGAATLSLPVEYAGPQGDIAGLDQVNVRLPRSLKNYYDVPWLGLTIDGKTTNQEMLLHLNYR